MDDSALGAAWRDDTPWDLLTDLAKRERLGGHPGERRAGERIVAALGDTGLDARLEPFATSHSRPARTIASVSPSGSVKTTS